MSILYRTKNANKYIWIAILLTLFALLVYSGYKFKSKPASLKAACICVEVDVTTIPFDHTIYTDGVEYEINQATQAIIEHANDCLMPSVESCRNNSSNDENWKSNNSNNDNHTGSCMEWNLKD